MSVDCGHGSAVQVGQACSEQQYFLYVGGWNDPGHNVLEMKYLVCRKKLVLIDLKLHHCCLIQYTCYVCCPCYLIGYEEMEISYQVYLNLQSYIHSYLCLYARKQNGYLFQVPGEEMLAGCYYQICLMWNDR